MDFLEFLDFAGVDLTKENEIVHYNTDSNQTIIEGWFDIVGNVFGKEPLSVSWSNDFSTTNIYFRRDERHAIRQEFIDLNTFGIEFTIVLEF